MYVYECDLVKNFENHIYKSENPFKKLSIAFEFSYENMRVDVVGVTENEELISFEAKLKDWRSAIQQAYRRTSFLHYSYVILPKPTVLKVIKYWHEFEARGIGLCNLTPTAIKIEVSAVKQIRFCSCYLQKLKQLIYEHLKFFRLRYKKLFYPKVLLFSFLVQ